MVGGPRGAVARRSGGEGGASLLDRAMSMPRNLSDGAIASAGVPAVPSTWFKGPQRMQQCSCWAGARSPVSEWPSGEQMLPEISLISCCSALMAGTGMIPKSTGARMASSKARDGSLLLNLNQPMMPLCMALNMALRSSGRPRNRWSHISGQGKPYRKADQANSRHATQPQANEPEKPVKKRSHLHQ